MLLLEFIDRLLLTDLVIKLILICALVAADQCLLLNGPELLLHFKEYPLVCDLLQVFCALQFLKLVPVQLEIVVLEEVYSLRIRQIDFLFLLCLGVDLQPHYLFLLVHYHCNQPYQLVANRLMLLAFYLSDLFLLADCWSYIRLDKGRLNFWLDLYLILCIRIFGLSVCWLHWARQTILTIQSVGLGLLCRLDVACVRLCLVLLGPLLFLIFRPHLCAGIRFVLLWLSFLMFPLLGGRSTLLVQLISGARGSQFIACFSCVLRMRLSIVV